MLLIDLGRLRFGGDGSGRRTSPISGIFNCGSDGCAANERRSASTRSWCSNMRRR
jgi:hypothetical protein